MIINICRRIAGRLLCFDDWLFAAKMARWGIKKYKKHSGDHGSEELIKFSVDCIHDYIQEMFDSGFTKLTIGFITWHEDIIKEAMEYRHSTYK